MATKKTSSNYLLFLLIVFVFLFSLTLCLAYNTDNDREKHSEEEQHEEEEGQTDNNPYFFNEESFNEIFKNQQGNIRVSKRFTERSSLLSGIDNYRLAFLEANPHTFILPNHFDAEAVFVIVKGKGTISLVRQDKRETYNVKRGDVIRIPAGTNIYLVNSDSNEKLQTAEIFQSISTPGRFREYTGLVGENPESYYRSFSSEILEAAFNTPMKKLDRLFGQQKKGIMVKASEEQIKALSKHSSDEKESGPFNLLEKDPSYSNKYGKMFQVDGNDYKQLQDLDIDVTFTNITKGAMIAPFYNSRSTRMVLIVEGKGYFEMACPHLSSQSKISQQKKSSRKGREQEQGGSSGAHYRRVSARLSPRTAFIIPAGHPTTVVASDNDNIQMVVFGINARHNEKNFLAGNENIMNQMAKEAMELGFNIPASEIEEIFNNQKQSFFLPGPHQCQKQREQDEGHRVPLQSIFNLVAF